MLSDLFRTTMGCSSSVVMQPSGSGFVKVLCLGKHQSQEQSPCPTLDSEKQQLIQETWRQMQPRSANIGRQIFLRIFEVEPRVKEAFKLGSTWGDDLINSKAFQRHAIESVHQHHRIRGRESRPSVRGGGSVHGWYRSRPCKQGGVFC